MNLLYLLYASIVLSGHVLASDSREPVPYVSIEIAGSRSTITDAHGVFFISGLQPGRVALHVHALGYRDTTFDVVIRRDTVVDLFLQIAPLSLAPVQNAIADRASSDAGPSASRLNAGQLRNLPHIGEADVFRALADLPSTSLVSDYSTALYVRGATPDQTEITLDGAPLLNPYHLGGLFGAVDPDIVSTVDVYAGARPATSAGSTGSEVRITTRDGSRAETHAQGALSLISSKASVEGPVSNHGSYIVSLRRTYLDAFTSMLNDVGVIDTDVPYNFLDAHAKLTFDAGKTSKFVLSGYTDAEHYDSRHADTKTGDINGAWRTRMAQAHFLGLLSPRVAADFAASITGFDANGVYGKDPLSGNDTATVDANMALARLRASVRAVHGSGESGVGVQLDYFSDDYDVASTGALTRLFPMLVLAQHATTASAFAERTQHVGAIALRAGARLAHARDETLLLPRIGLSWPLTQVFILTAGFGEYAQLQHGLRNEESALARVFSYDLYLNGESFIRSSDVVAGVTASTSSLNASAQLYSRRASRINVPLPPADPAETALLDAGIPYGRSRSWGIELTGSRMFAGTSIDGNYAFRSQRVFVAGQSYRPSYVRDQQLSLRLQHAFGAGTSGSMRIVWQSGLPYTPALSAERTYEYSGDPRLPYYTPSGDVIELGALNSKDLPAYFRVDVGARKEGSVRVFGKRIALRSYLDVNNLFNNKNALWGLPRLQATPQLEYGPQTPFLPTLGIEWRF